MGTPFTPLPRTKGSGGTFDNLPQHIDSDSSAHGANLVGVFQTKPE